MRASVVVTVLIACGVPRSDPPIALRVTAPFPVAPAFRLPHTFEPRSYRARLALSDGHFTGHIEIVGDVSEELPVIWLHASNLVVSSATATRDTKTVAVEVTSPRADQLLGLRSPGAFKPGSWTIAIDYGGQIHGEEPPTTRPGSDSPVDSPGLGVFERVLGVESYVFTQSEPVFAREIFPCIDEPDRKVPWQLTLDVRKSLVAASNTPIVRETSIDADHKRVEFAPTLPLPSYLVAFAVGPFDLNDEGKARSGVPIRVLVPHGERADAGWLTAKSVELFDVLEGWFGVPYPYAKLDLVAVPRFGWGGMENAGLITLNRQQVMAGGTNSWLIAHELAHQWFGDLVTAAWWDDIWLNESFATFIESEVSERSTKRTPDMLEQRDDAIFRLGEAHAIRVPVTGRNWLEFAPQESIDRGAALLKLLEATLGAETFGRAVRSYLTKHANGSVTTSNLAAALSGTSRRSLDTTIMQLLAHPVPTLYPELSCENGRAQLHISLVPWPMPVCVAYDRDGSRAETCARLDADALDVPLPSRSCPSWVMPNPGATGFYRTTWTKPLVDAIVGHGWSALTTSERRLVFDELEEFADLEDDVLALTVFIRAPEDLPARTAAAFLVRVARYVPDKLRVRFNDWSKAHFGALVRDLRFTIREGDSMETQHDQLAAAELLALTGDPDLIKNATQPSASDLGAHGVFLRSRLTIAVNTDPTLIERLVDLLIAKSPPARFTILEALSSVHNLIAIMARMATKLTKLETFDLVMLFHDACDASQRAQLVALAKSAAVDLDNVLAEVDRCITQRQAMEPVFRAWLDPPIHHH